MAAAKTAVVLIFCFGASRLRVLFFYSWGFTLAANIAVYLSQSDGQECCSKLPVIEKTQVRNEIGTREISGTASPG